MPLIYWKFLSLLVKAVFGLFKWVLSGRVCIIGFFYVFFYELYYAFLACAFKYSAIFLPETSLCRIFLRVLELIAQTSIPKSTYPSMALYLFDLLVKIGEFYSAILSCCWWECWNFRDDISHKLIRLGRYALFFAPFYSI